MAADKVQQMNTTVFVYVMLKLSTDVLEHFTVMGILIVLFNCVTVSENNGFDLILTQAWQNGRGKLGWTSSTWSLKLWEYLNGAMLSLDTYNLNSDFGLFLAYTLTAGQFEEGINNTLSL